MNNMKDKTVLITGANSGIGYITTREIAKMGAKVVMLCRSEQRGRDALAKAKQESGSDDIHLLLCDLSSQADIRRAMEQFKLTYDRLDVLVNNAGAIFTKRQESVDGIEMTFAINHLGYYLPTLLLLDMLKESAPARIVNVSSGAHETGKFNFDDYNREQNFSSFAAYGESKMANILFTKELARRLEGTGVTVNALHPGFVATNFAKNTGLLGKLAMTFIAPIVGISPEKGAQTSIYLATSPEVDGVTGEYFAKSKVKKTHAFAQNVEAQKRLWALSEELTGVKLS